MNATACRLPERDRAGLVEQQRGDVAGGLDRAAAHREHVALHEPVHPRDADRGQQPADRRRDQTDEQRDQHRVADAVCPRRSRTAAARRTTIRKMIVNFDEQQREGDLVRRLLPLGALDQPDHPVDEPLAGLDRDPDLDPVRQHLRAAGHGGPVAAGLADHGRRLARDRGLVDRGDPFDDLAVARDQLAGRHQDDVAARAGRMPGPSPRAPSSVSRRATRSARVLRRDSACAFPRPSAIASAKFANSTVNHRPMRDRGVERDRPAARRRRRRSGS